MLADTNLIWIDLEMTGLEPDTDLIIEMATIVTDSDLNVLAEGPVIAVHQSDAALAGMDEWNTRTHGESGLIQRVREQTAMEMARTPLDMAKIEAGGFEVVSARIDVADLLGEVVALVLPLAPRGVSVSWCVDEDVPPGTPIPPEAAQPVSDSATTAAAATNNLNLFRISLLLCCDCDCYLDFRTK